MNSKPDQAQTTAAQRERRTSLAALALAVAFLLVAALIVVVVSSDVFNCSPPSERELKTQETFVRTHLADARDVQSDVADCDDNGDGYVSFTTDLSPTAARDAFLADDSCSRYVMDGDDDDGSAVQCRTGGSMVFVFFNTFRKDDTTAGSLTFS